MEEPDVETIEAYKNQLDTWKAEGYDVIRLEQQYFNDQNRFAQIFPIFSSNIFRLKNIATKLSTMNTIGHEDQVNSIKAKLYKPDQTLATEGEFKDLESKIRIAPIMINGEVASDIQDLSLSPAPTPGTVPKLPEPEIDQELKQLLPAAIPTEKELSNVNNELAIQNHDKSDE